MIYCIDSNIIIWGIKEQASSGQEDMIPRAKKLFNRFDEYQDYVLVPTVVLAEILAPEPATIRANIMEVLNKSFILAPFDERAALKYAEILHGRFEEIRDKSSSTGTARQKMKVDHMIIAIAIVNNANCIYSTDPGLKVFAQGLIDVKDLPPLVEPTIGQTSSQTKLFEITPTIKSEEEGKQEEETPF